MKYHFVVYAFLITSCTSVHYDAKWGETEKVDTYIERGKNLDAPNFYQETPLMVAARYGKGDIMRHLIAAGADFESPNKEKITPLMYAINHNQYESTEILLKAGADPNQSNDYGWTPLMATSRYASEDIILLLVDSGADIFAATRIGRTARRVAVESGRILMALFIDDLEEEIRQREEEN